MDRAELPDVVARELEKHRGVELHGPSLRVVFVWKGTRYRESLGLPPTRQNIRHAAQLRAAVLHDIKMGAFEFARHFPNSKHAGPVVRHGLRLADLADRYLQLKAVDITAETESRYRVALASTLELLGRQRLAQALLPEDIQHLRVELVSGRAVATANHYLAVLDGFLRWLESNGYCRTGLAAAAVRFAAVGTDPDPLTRNEVEQIITKGCLHPADAAAVTLAVYTGIRPGELCALAMEDVDLEQGLIHVRRSITRQHQFKVPKTGRPRAVQLMPPALEAAKALLQLAAEHSAEEVTVYINRHETRTDVIRPLLSPVTQARKRVINRWFCPTAWQTKWTALLRRAEVRHRRPYQTRHTFACWCLTAHGNLAFIADQMGHADYSMLVKVYGRWIDDESRSEVERIWRGIQNLHGKPQ